MSPTPISGGTDIFPKGKPIIGMLHLPALPGSPANELLRGCDPGTCIKDAEALATGGVDGLILENFGDVPFYPRRVPPQADSEEHDSEYQVCAP
jgi:predicted TIM-barrel enzyme